MKNNDPNNPFLLSGYQHPALFCDREQETDLLLSHIKNGRNTTLLSLRRMGKTSLIHHVIFQLHQQKLGLGIYVDVFDTGSLQDLTNKIVSAVLNAMPEKDPFWKRAMDFIKQLRPVVSYDSMTGAPQVSLDFTQNKQYEKSLESIFQFLDSQNMSVLIAIDEFQQITQYPEKNIEAILRTQIQNLHHVRFIFSGSSPHLLAEMFHHAKRPFFSSTQTLGLKTIPAENYAQFIAAMFAQNNRIIKPEAITYIIEFSKLHTYYTQWLCNQVFATNKAEVNIDDVRQEVTHILKQNEPVYFQYRSLLTANQWNMLKAIAKEGQIRNPNSKEILIRYKLGGSSVVQRSLDALLTKEMIYSETDSTGKYYSVYDCFLSRWLELS